MSLSATALKSRFRALGGSILLMTGRLDSLRRLDFGRIERLVFVCRGNVCRSPFAEAAARSAGLSAASCGVDVAYSAPAEPAAIVAGRRRGIDLSRHMSRSVFDVSLRKTDCLVAMDPSHLPVVRKAAAQAGCQMTLMGLWRTKRTTGIADPYGKSVEIFVRCFDEIEEAIAGLAAALKAPAGGQATETFASSVGVGEGQAGVADGSPDLSFVIPALNEEEHIGGVLSSIEEYAGNRFRYEVVVVDNGSTDGTVDVARSRGAICLRATDCTISELRNIGAMKARSELLVFLDADVYLVQGWSDRMAAVKERLDRQPETITGSTYGISDNNNWIEEKWFAPRVRSNTVKYINGGHMVLRRPLFERVGGFDTTLQTGEDYEFCSRAASMGIRIENDSALKVVHAGYPKTLRAFFCRERWHGRGDCKSLTTLVSSKPGLVTLGNAAVAAGCLAGATMLPAPPWLFAGAYFVFLAGVSVAASASRCTARHLAATSFLYMVYFTARTFSLMDILAKAVAGRLRIGGGRGRKTSS